MSAEAPQRIAVIGGGISGILSAHLLSRLHDVHLFEAADYLGGHTLTKTISSGEDAGANVDCGFIVLNDRTYPTLHNFFRQLGVEVRWSDMSFSFFCEKTGCLYAGTELDRGLGLNGLFADRSNLFRPSFWGFLRGIREFCDKSLAALAGEIPPSLTLGEWARQIGTAPRVLSDYVVPMGGAIWSASVDEILSFPAATFLNFFRNHGLLNYRDRPRWQTVVGGSKTYVERFIGNFRGDCLLRAPVQSIRRHDDRVEISVRGETLAFDQVIIAVHADQVLKLLADPSEAESQALKSWSYSNNRVVLHTDESFLPPKRAAWASWNYRRERLESGAEPVSVTYHMNRLQGLNTKAQYCVTLNPRREPRPEAVILDQFMSHPQYTLTSLSGRTRLAEISGERRTFYAGAFMGFGFHEDGAKSAVEVARKFGINL